MKRQSKMMTGAFGDEELRISAAPAYLSESAGEMPDLIHISSRNSILSFQFSMTKEQAIDLAAALVDFATEEEEATEEAAQ